ncbi:MAG: ABC transporter ATP-binding protein [Deltaproteobacteria bacterium]|nr:ABC transporter ATP-binding protein [Deltaproteobacteria bacterium]
MTSPDPNPLLSLEGVDAGYGKKPVLSGVSLKVRAAEFVGVIGPNGAGKSTALKVAAGLLPAWSGKVVVEGVVIARKELAARIGRDTAYLPQGRRVFPDLTVAENLEIGGHRLPRALLRRRIEETLATFPGLQHQLGRAAGSLSGGEQQTVALARALMPAPRLLLLDEPSLGLSPQAVAGVFEMLSQLIRRSGLALLVVEQKVRDLLAACGRVYALRGGQVVHEGEASELAASPEKLRALFM